MIELINTAVQTVDIGQSVVYNTAAVRSTCGRERHRPGSAFVTLLPPGRYLVTFSANIAVPTGETVGEISLGIILCEQKVIQHQRVPVWPALTPPRATAAHPSPVEGGRQAPGARTPSLLSVLPASAAVWGT